jgi:hypothetical protein
MPQQLAVIDRSSGQIAIRRVPPGPAVWPRPGKNMTQRHRHTWIQEIIYRYPSVGIVQGHRVPVVSQGHPSVYQWYPRDAHLSYQWYPRDAHLRYQWYPRDTHLRYQWYHWDTHLNIMPERGVVKVRPVTGQI